MNPFRLIFLTLCVMLSVSALSAQNAIPSEPAPAVEEAGVPAPAASTPMRLNIGLEGSAQTGDVSVAIQLVVVMTLLTLAPLRGISAGSFLVCSNVVDAPATQWSAEQQRAATLTAAPVALSALLSEPKPK